MIKTLTEHDVLKFVYEKTSNPSLENEITINDNLLNEFVELEKAKGLLDALSLEPSKSTIDSILNYSKY
jgi:hypothetical protein